MLNVCDKNTYSVRGVLSYRQDEVVGLEDAAVSQAARLAAGGELHEAGRVGTWTVDIDGEGDALLTTDAVAVGGGNVPHAPGDTDIDH